MLLMKNKSQVLIVIIWVLLILTVLTISAAHRGSFALRLSGFQNDSLNSQGEFLPKTVLTDVESLSFEYGFYDNQTVLNWNNAWSEIKKLPAAVKVKLVMMKNLNKEFKRVIYLLNGCGEIENVTNEE